MERTRNFFGHFFLALVALIGLTGCPMNKYAPENFFEGQELEAARAIKDGRNNELSSLITGLDLNKPGKKQMTLLWFAIQEKNFDAIRLIVQHGAKPDEQGVNGLGTALSFALQHKDLRYLTAMLDGGLPLNMQKEYGASLLQRAAGAEGATLDHVKLLVERGAHLETKDSLGVTALITAMDTNQPERAIYLVEKGANVDVIEDNGVSAMWSVKLSIESQQPGEMRTQFEKLRDLMISKGAKYPPDPPAEVRKWMRAQGMKVSGKD
jgi:ankyrin repeat protein